MVTMAISCILLCIFWSSLLVGVTRVNRGGGNNINFESESGSCFPSNTVIAPHWIELASKTCSRKFCGQAKEKVMPWENRLVTADMKVVIESLDTLI